MSNRGRKSKYETHVKPRLFEIKHWCREGLLEEEICKRLDVGLSTFQVYKNENKELLEALKEGKEIADFMVEDSLFKRAMGYQYTERTIESNGDIKVVYKQQPPDTTAQIFWLKNRRPDKWRDKQHHDVNVEIKKLEDFF